MAGNNTRTLLIGGGLAAVLILAAVAVWYQFFRDTAPATVSIESAVESIQGSAEPTATVSSSQGGDVSQLSTLDGTWVIADIADGFVGYRIGEVLVSIGATEAVGRTSDIEGSGTIDGSLLTSASFTADLTGLTSDDSRRDGQLRNQALETSAFPTATFELTNPVELPAELESGEPVTIAATGTLTLHGVSREVTIPLELQLVDNVLAAVGTIEILLADYDISQPSAGSVVSVDDHAQMEIQIFLVRESV